jgi:Cation efflux family
MIFFGFNESIRMTQFFSACSVLGLGHSYGFHRAEVIAALGSVLTIWILTFYLVQAAIERLRNPEPINAKLVSV